MKQSKKNKIIFFTGKGGVGKSTLSAAKALSLSEKNYRVLHVEMGSSNFLKNLYEKEIGQSPLQITENLDAASFNSTDCIKEFIDFYLRLKKISSLFVNNSVIQGFINSAPGLSDLTVLGKITSGVTQIGPPFDYDYVIIDAYSTGHFKALIKAGLSIGKVFGEGSVGEQSRSMMNVLKNEEYTQFFLVGLPDQLAFEEVFELKEFLEEQLNCKPKVILNKSFDLKFNLTDLPVKYRENEFLKNLNKKKNWEHAFKKDLDSKNISFVTSKNLTSIVKDLSLLIGDSHIGN